MEEIQASKEIVTSYKLRVPDLIDFPLTQKESPHLHTKSIVSEVNEKSTEILNHIVCELIACSYRLLDVSSLLPLESSGGSKVCNRKCSKKICRPVCNVYKESNDCGRNTTPSFERRCMALQIYSSHPGFSGYRK